MIVEEPPIRLSWRWMWGRAFCPLSWALWWKGHHRKDGKHPLPPFWLQSIVCLPYRHFPSFRWWSFQHKHDHTGRRGFGRYWGGRNWKRLFEKTLKVVILSWSIEGLSLNLSPSIFETLKGSFVFIFRSFKVFLYKRSTKPMLVPCKKIMFMFSRLFFKLFS